MQKRTWMWAALALLAVSAETPAAISGVVVDDGTGQPIAGAEVRVQADPSSPVVLTNAAGQWTINIAPPAGVNLAASVRYNHSSNINYVTNTAFAVNGNTGIEIRLPRLPVASNNSYVPPTSQLCGACHIDQAEQWSTSRHAGAARNEWVLDLHSGTGTPGGGAGYVFTQTHDPGETGFCATCHAQMQDVFTPGQLQLNQATTPHGQDGVGCLACHQIADVDVGQIQGLHHVGGKTDYRFPDPTEHPTAFYVFGALPDVDAGFMRNIYNPLFEQPLLCASCHQYNNPETGVSGQNTYFEWLASPYAQPGPGFRTCQNCHMPNETTPGVLATTSSVERPPSQRHRHTFIGATPTTLSGAILLRISAREQAGQIVVDAEVENRGAGHAFPTGIAIRNAILSMDVRLDGQPLTQVGGPNIPWWANDEVPGTQPGDLAGLPGKGFAKVLEGRINGQGPVVRPVLFIDGERVAEDSVIPSGQTDRSTYRFQIPQGTPVGRNISVDARLLYRRAWRALAVTKGWTQTPGGMPIEIQVAQAQATLATQGTSAVGIPSLNWWSIGLLVSALGLAGIAVLRR